MLDILPEIQSWIAHEQPFVLATVMKTWGSAPRKMGASMAVRYDGAVAGSVSGGCVEGDVAVQAAEVLAENLPRKVHYGVTDDDAWAVGLSCGGKINVLLEPFFHADNRERDSEFWGKVNKLSDTNLGGAILRNLNSFTRTLLFADQDASTDMEFAALRAFRERSHRMLGEGDDHFFAQILPPRNRLILIGAAHVTVDLVRIGKEFGFETIVIDPRSFFTEKTTFPVAPDRIIAEWPAEVLSDFPIDSYTFVAVLSHDPKIDDQALQILLRSDVAYIGALGSKRTHAKRVDRLREAGFAEEEIDRIHAPIGLAINAQSAKEIALSIFSQIIATKNQHV